MKPYFIVGHQRKLKCEQVCDCIIKKCNELTIFSSGSFFMPNGCSSSKLPTICGCITGIKLYSKFHETLMGGILTKSFQMVGSQLLVGSWWCQFGLEPYNFLFPWLRRNVKQRRRCQSTVKKKTFKTLKKVHY